MAASAKECLDTLNAAASETPLPPAATRVLVALFLLLLLFPGGKLALQVLYAKVQEHRGADAKDLIIARQPGESWSRYFESHFAGRELLIRGNAYLKTGLLRTSISPKVLIGQDGWLYYADEHGIEDVRNQEPFSDAQLQAWGSYLIALSDFAAAHQAHFVLAIAPNKQTVYPEHLPAWVTQLGPQSRLDQLLGYLRAHRNMAIVDLREPLRRGKSTAQLYYRADTHWNMTGGLLGYREIAQQVHALYPGFAVPELDNFTSRIDSIPGGDLANMLGSPELFRESATILVPKQPLHAAMRPAESSIPHNPRPRTLQISEKPGASVARAVIYHDSFFTFVNSLIAEEVARGIFVWAAAVDYSLLAREHPDLVILEMVERRLFGPAPGARPPKP